MSVSCGRSCHRHLGRDRPFTLKLKLVPLKRLLPAAFQVGAVVVFRHTVLNEGDKQAGEDEIRGDALCRRTLNDNVGTARRDGGLQSCSEPQRPGTGSASWRAL